MIRRNYYCLIAGLPDITYDDKKLHFSSSGLKDYLKEELHRDDFELVRLFFYPFDNQNLMNLLFKKEREWDKRGNLTEEQLEHLIVPRLFEEVRKSQYPGYLCRFGRLLRDKEEVEERITWQETCQFLTEEYYQTLIKSECKFIRDVADHRINTGNILLALNGRKHELPYEDVLIGDNLVAQAIRKNRTRDFGLAIDYPETESIIQLYENENMLERELRLDQRQWNYLDEITFFNYFSIERVLAFVLKIFIVERWFHLDYETGQVVFNRLLKDIESSFEFPEEFSNTYGKKK